MTENAGKKQKKLTNHNKKIPYMLFPPKYALRDPKKNPCPGVAINSTQAQTSRKIHLYMITNASFD